MTEGKCYNLPEAANEAGDVGSASEIDCEELHDIEVYQTRQEADSSFPGDLVLDERSIDFCLSAFEDFVGVEYEVSIYDLFYLYPSSESWAQQDDRQTVCGLTSLDGERIAGSRRGAAE